MNYSEIDIEEQVLVADSPPHGLGTNIHYLSVLLAKVRPLIIKRMSPNFFPGFEP